MKTKKIELNTNYYIKITSNDTTTLYTLKDNKEDKTIIESYSRDSFLIKCRQYIKLSNMQELVISSY